VIDAPAFDHMPLRTLVVGFGRPWEGRRSGGRIRCTAVLRALAPLGPLDFVSLTAPGSPRGGASPFGSVAAVDVGSPRPSRRGRLAWHAMMALNRDTVLPYDLAAYGERRRRSVGRRLGGLLGDHDLVWVMSARAAHFCPPALLERAVVDLFDLHQEGCERELGLVRSGKAVDSGRFDRWSRTLYLRHAARAWSSWTRRVAGDVRSIVVVKESDRDRLGVPNAVVIPNGADLPDRPLQRAATDPPRLVFVGTLGYGPNRDGVLWLLREVLPILETLTPRVEVRVIGDRADDLGRLAENPRVRVQGYVEDLDAALSQAAVAVVPLRTGTGTRLKVLEAFAHRVPVVSTSVGCDGLDVVHGEHLLVADSAVGFARACAAVLGDSEMGEGLAARAEALVRERYDWTLIEGQIRAVAVGCRVGLGPPLPTFRERIAPDARGGREGGPRPTLRRQPEGVR